MNWRILIPFFDPSLDEWALQARLLRWLTFLWLAIGLVILYSASFAVGEAEFNDGLYYFKRQLFWAIVGLIGFNLAANYPLRYLLGWADGLFLLGLGLTVLTLVPGLGTTVNGATRWLNLVFVPIQPSELLKPILVLQGARIFGQWHRLGTARRFVWLGIFAVSLVAILLQPNLSTAALCGLTLWLMALAAGLPYWQLGGTAITGLVMLAVSLATREYQRRRIISFLNPWADPQQDGYQLIQSLLAIGSGGAWGSGYGESQQKLFYLPIQYTDFIFAVFAEEFGFVGGMVLLLLLASYATLGLWTALSAQWSVHRLVAIGVVILLVGQSLLNMGVATGALPTTGLPFPLFSYGGSSLIASLFSAGLLVRVAREASEADVLSLDRRRQH